MISFYFRDATNIIKDLQEVVSELEQEHSIVPINVELIGLELAIVYANSKKSEVDFFNHEINIIFNNFKSFDQIVS